HPSHTIAQPSPPPSSASTDTEWPCSRLPAWPIPAPILTQSPVSSTDGKPPGEQLALTRRFEVGRGGGAWGFVMCASARPVHRDSVNTTIAVSFLVAKLTAQLI